jgi:seryl-tRNA synthetase
MVQPVNLSLRQIDYTMLQVQVLRNNPDGVKERLAVKHFKQPELVDAIIALDDERKRLQTTFDTAQASINAASKQIGQLMAQGKKEEAEAMKATVANHKESVAQYSTQLVETEQKLTDALIQLPNLPAAEVPLGKTPEENVTVKTGGTIPALYEGAAPHWDLVEKYQLINFELGNKVTGSGFPFYIGKGAKLQRSLIQYFLDFNTAAGYLEYLPPFMVNETSAYSTGQLPDKEGQMYHATADNFYLIPTAEVPVTNVYRDTILKQADLPIKMTAYSPCFRREAGSYGKDVRGLNRLHQFEKVEIIQIVEPSTSYATLDSMVAHVEQLVQSLELPYRILRLCGGDMSFTSAITYDFEVFSAAQQRWLEVSSVSNFEGFQTNRMKCRYKNAEGKINLTHSLNGSSLALPRILAALLENNQTADGIKIPAVLQSYFGAAIIS